MKTLPAAPGVLMSRCFAAVVVVLATSTVAGAETRARMIDVRIDAARFLARHGRCAEAVRTTAELAYLSPDDYEALLDRDEAVATCIAGLPRVAPTAPAGVTEPGVRGRPTCSTTAFDLEPSLLRGSRETVHRLGFDAKLRRCDKNGAHPLLRIGVTVAVFNEGAAIGLETELEHRTSRYTSAGIRIGLETGSSEQSDKGVRLSLGGRLHIADAVFIAVEAVEARQYHVHGIRTQLFAGVGFDGHPGNVIGGLELTAFVALFALVSATNPRL